MSLQGIEDLDTEWFMNNTLTVNNNVIVDGNITTTGFVYDGGIPLDYLNTNNVWTGQNVYTNDLPTYLDPVANNQMATKNYLDGAVVGLGDGLLITNNNWSANNGMTNLPVITETAVADQLLNKSGTDADINADTGKLTTTNVWTKQNTFNNVVSVPSIDNNPTADLQRFVNVSYINNKISSYIPEPQFDFFQYAFGDVGTRNFTCDPNGFSGCLVLMCSSGGRGTFNLPPSPHVPTSNDQTFGQAGGFAAFKLPAWSGNAIFGFSASAYGGVVGSCQFDLPAAPPAIPTTVCGITNGAWGSNPVEGGAVSFSSLNNFTDGQAIKGNQAATLPTPSLTTFYCYNPGVYNGLALGGSYNDVTGISIPPTGGGCVIFRFKKLPPI